MTRPLHRSVVQRLHRAAGPDLPAPPVGDRPVRFRLTRLPTDRRTLLVVGALLVVYVVWGSTFLAIKFAIESVPPFTMMAIRFTIAGSLLFAWAVRRGDRVGDRPTWRQWRNAISTGALLLVGGTGLVSLAQTRIASGTAALLCATVPLWLAILGRTFLKERLTTRAWIGLAIGFVGVATLVDPRGGGEIGALLLVLLGSLAWAVGSLRSRTADTPKRPMVAASMEMLGAAAVFALVAVLSGETARVEWASVTREAVLAIVYLTTAGSLVAFTSYSWLLRNAPTTLVGTYAYVNPVVAVLLGWALAGEVVTGRTVLAGAVILGSVVLLITGRPGQPVPAQPTSGGNVFAGDTRWYRARRRFRDVPVIPRRTPRASPLSPARVTGAGHLQAAGVIARAGEKAGARNA